MIYAATGHRLEPLGGNTREVEDKVIRYAKKILQPGSDWVKPNFLATYAISGMAIGWDTAYALAALEWNIPLIAAVPFEGQEAIWPQYAKDRYHEILKAAHKVVYVCSPGYMGWKFHERDKWMVAESNEMIALWNGHPKGGTAATIRYAEKANRVYHNVWPGWEQFEASNGTA